MFTHADKCLGMNRVASHEIDLSSVETRWQVPLSNKSNMRRLAPMVQCNRGHACQESVIDADFLLAWHHMQDKRM